MCTSGINCLCFDWALCCLQAKWHQPIYFMVQHISPTPVSLSGFFMLFLHLQFSHCLNSLIPCESGRLHRLGSALFAPSTLISEHRSPHCDQLNPLRIIYQPLWCALPDIILWQCWEWLDFTRGTLPLWDQKKHLVYKTGVISCVPLTSTLSNPV